MDPRVLAEKKGLAIARIEAGLALLVSKGFAGSSAADLRAATAARNEPGLNDLKRIEVIADLVDALLAVGVVEKVPKSSQKTTGV